MVHNIWSLNCIVLVLLRVQETEADWLIDVLQQQASHTALPLLDHERPAVLLRMPAAGSQCEGC